MAVQVSYPGVYIDEFAPGAPIEGAGTSTAAFIGVATAGPIDRPTPIDSWDAFQQRFGGFVASGPGRFLAPAVYGFFVNGGRRCYVQRAATARTASAALAGRGAGGDPVLEASARQEGVPGNGVTVTVADASRLAALLAQQLPARPVVNVSANRKRITVADNSGWQPGLVARLSKPGQAASVGVVAAVTGADTIDLVAALPSGSDFTGGEIAPAGVVQPLRVETAVSAVSADRTTLTVASSTGFAPGERVMVEKASKSAAGTVGSVPAANLVVLDAPLPGADDFTGGKLRSGDLEIGDQRIRLALPAALAASQAMPPGTRILIEGDSTEAALVASAGGDVIELDQPLANKHSLKSEGSLPRISTQEFDLRVDRAGSPGDSESFAELSMDPRHPGYWGSLAPALVELREPAVAPAPAPADPRPAAGAYALAGGAADDQAAAWAALAGDPKRYLDRFRAREDINLVCIPGATDKAVQRAMIDHCESLMDRVAILDPVFGAEPADGIDAQVVDVRSERGYAALYYPWIQVRAPASGRDELWPPCGHVCGVIARTDAERGVHKAPANTAIRGAIGVERRLSNDQQGPLNLMGVNVLRVLPGRGQPIVWGARTTTTDTNWQYLNVRRLFAFLEESIQRGIEWSVFEPNNLELWQKLRRTISDFLTRVWRDGALFGETAADAFYVRIDEVLNPPSTQALGRLYIEIGVAPAYPAEFIVVRIGIWRGGSEVNES